MEYELIVFDMVGDYIFDLQAATNAGTHSALLLEPDAAIPDFAHEATYLIRKLEDIEVLPDAPAHFLYAPILTGATKQ